MIGKEKERILLTLHKNKILEAEKLAEKKGISRNDIFTIAIYEYLQRERYKEI